MADTRNCAENVSMEIAKFRTKNEQMQDIRTAELSRLNGVTYVDHAGAALYTRSQLDAVHADLSACVYGNPHSGNLRSRHTADLIEQARHRVLAHFNTSHENYSVIFTSGATASFKLLAESFQFNANSKNSTQILDTAKDKMGAMYYLDDNHTSVVGMREIAKYRGVRDIFCVTPGDVEESVNRAKQARSHRGNLRKCKCGSSNLFIYPAQSNFCGYKYPLSWISDIQEYGLCDVESRRIGECWMKDKGSCGNNMHGAGDGGCLRKQCQGSGCQGPSCQGPACQGPGCQGPGCQGPSCQGPSCQGPSCQGSGCQGPGRQGSNCHNDTATETDSKQCNGNDDSLHEKSCRGDSCQGNSSHRDGCHGDGCHGKWYVCLDAAALVSTSPLDLSTVQPDFVAVSFYKMFGYPTGIGALLVRRGNEDVMQKTYFGGGTVQVAIAGQDFHVKKTQLEDRFEDGTVNFLNIIALRHGFDSLLRIGGSMPDISLFAYRLAAILFHSLHSLHHSNGNPTVRLYHHGGFQSPRQQGPIVNFSVLRADGTVVGYSQVEKLAAAYNIELRTGCFCNLGACQKYLKLSHETVRKNFQAGHVCGDNMDLIEGQPTGSVRVSFGYLSTMRDVEEIVTFIVSCFVDAADKTKTCQDIIDKAMDVVFATEAENSDSEIQPIRALVTDEKIGRASTSTKSIPPVGKAQEGAESRSHPIKKSLANEDMNQAMEKLDTNENMIQPIRKPDTKEINQSEPTITPEMSDTEKMRLKRIFLYPVKSCAAFEVSSWEICARGLRYDREWMVVNGAGVCLTQKRVPRLCRIVPRIDVKRGKLMLTCEDSYAEALSLPLELDHPENLSCLSVCHSKVCGDRISVVDCGDEAAQWIEAVLEEEGARLVRQHSMLPTRIAKKAAGSSLSLANEAPYLLLNEASVQLLHTHLCTRLPAIDVPDVDELIERFRGNLVIQGAQGLVEKSWCTVTIGNHMFQSVGPCTRCQMICVDQRTGHRLKEMLPALLSFANHKNEFGVLLRHCPSEEREEEYCTISVSDAVSADAVSADAVSADAVSADAVSANAVSADAVSTDAVPIAVSGDEVSQ